jgi:hypothetical protein
MDDQRGFWLLILKKKKEERETGGLGFWASLTWPFTPSKFSPYL